MVEIVALPADVVRVSWDPSKFDYAGVGSELKLCCTDGRGAAAAGGLLFVLNAQALRLPTPLLVYPWCTPLLQAGSTSS